MFLNRKGEISCDALILFGLLNCPGDGTHKSEAFYPVLQEGGRVRQPRISNADKDIKVSLQKLVQLVTLDLNKLIQDVDGIHPMDLEDKEDEIDYIIDDMLEWNYLEPIYELKSAITYEEWVETSAKQRCIYDVWYNPQNLRALTFTRAGIEMPEVEQTAFN